jgi:phosphoenolpyruvate synthase/pyruvate phosphate dikinase
MFKIARKTVFIKIYRRDALAFSLYATNKLLLEISKRAHLPLSLVRYILPQEAERAVEDTNFKRILLKRSQYCVYLYKNKKLVVLVGNEAKKVMNNLLVKTKKLNIFEFRGTVVFPGKVQGKVKIINKKEDVGKMKKNDILVSIATIPEIVSAMKQAGAIITDVGGLTSHAAIIARELKKPCIIGTKIATKVLKDGDLVEVDATRGIVKKL